MLYYQYLTAISRISCESRDAISCTLASDRFPWIAQVFEFDSLLKSTTKRNSCEFGIGRGNLPGEIRFQNPRATGGNVTDRNVTHASTIPLLRKWPDRAIGVPQKRVSFSEHRPYCFGRAVLGEGCSGVLRSFGSGALLICDEFLYSPRFSTGSGSSRTSCQRRYPANPQGLFQRAASLEVRCTDKRQKTEVTTQSAPKGLGAPPASAPKPACKLDTR